MDRAFTDEQKMEVVERLFAVWIRNPELRLGQLVANAVDDPNYIFNVEDYHLLALLEAFAARRRN